jgi:hypothetical protein
MKPYQIVLIVVLAVVAFGGSIGLLVVGMTVPAADAGTSFLRQIATAGPDAAYASAAPVFQAQTSRAALADLSKRLGLADFDDVSWTSRSINGSNATIGGTATLKSGMKLPIEIVLVKQNDVWMVAALSVAGGLTTGAGTGTNLPKN